MKKEMRGNVRREIGTGIGTETGKEREIVVPVRETVTASDVAEATNVLTERERRDQGAGM